MLGYYAMTAAIAAGVLGWAGAQPHTVAPAAESECGPADIATLLLGYVVAEYRLTVSDTIADAKASDQVTAKMR